MLEYTLLQGGKARILETNGDVVVLLSSASSPPGSMFEFRADERSFKVKVRGCRREKSDSTDTMFRIDGRFINLSRAEREFVLSDSKP